MAVDSFNAIPYMNSCGEKCVATKKDGVATIQGDKNGVCRMPLDKFDQSKVSLERTPSEDSVSFKGKVKNNDATKTEPAKKKSGFAKKSAVAIASSVVPGLGQAINGQWGKAAFYALGAPALSVGVYMLHPIAGAAFGIGTYFANIISAYRNA